MADMDMNADRGGEAVATSVAFTAVAAAFVILRWTARFGVLHNTGIDDYLIMCSVILSIGLTVCIHIQAKNGLGKHFKTVEPHEFVTLMKSFYGSVPIYLTGLAFTKVSIVMQYLRVFVGTVIQRACRITLIIVIVYGLWTFWSAVFTCFPVAKFWDPTVKEGYCMNFTALWFSNASVNIVTDLIIFLLPVPVIRSLNLPRKQKIGLMMIFAVGLFACVTSVLRLRSLYVASVSTDLTYDNVGAATWSAVELNVGIICACLPMMKPLLVRLFPRLLASTSLNSRPENAYYGRDQSRGFGNVSTVKSMASRDYHEWQQFDNLSKREEAVGVAVTDVSTTVNMTRPSGRGDMTPRDKIKVMTSVTQEVEEGSSRSDTSSDKDMIYRGDELRV